MSLTRWKDGVLIYSDKADVVSIVVTYCMIEGYCESTFGLIVPQIAIPLPNLAIGGS